MLKRELYLNAIRKFMNQPELVKVITGIRRCGKSVLLQLIQNELLTQGVSPNQIIAYNFEDLNLQKYTDGLLLHEQIMRQSGQIKGRVYLFLDEVQEVDQWEKCVNSLRINSDIDIYVTGSNASLLTGDYSTYLSGRYIETRMYPFAFQEFMAYKKLNNPETQPAQAFNEYIKIGGMPFAVRLADDEMMVRQYLRDLFSSVVVKDIMKRNAFRDVDSLERIIAYVLANIGTTFSASSLNRFFKSERRSITTDTILNYLKACEEAYLFCKVPYEDINGKKILQVNEKYFASDHGLREALTGRNQSDIGLVLENIVFMELLRRGYNVAVGRTDGHEIDFVCDRQNERRYYQVAYLLSDPSTVDREFGAYRDIRDHYPKYVLSMDTFDRSRDGIVHQNIIDFLLDLS